MARAAVLAARALGLDARLNSIRVSGPRNESDTSLLQVSKSLPNRVNTFHVNADESAAVLKTIGEPFQRERSGIGLWAWELEDFPLESTSAQKVCADFGLDPRSFLFLTAFDMLSVFERKNTLAVGGRMRQRLEQILQADSTRSGAVS